MKYIPIYEIEGIVEKGEGLASRLFQLPTANVYVLAEKAPETGVYIGHATWKGQEWPSLICVNEDQKRKIEVHLFDVEAHLTGDQINVRIKEKISDFVPWESEDQMRQKIHADAARARILLEIK